MKTSLFILGLIFSCALWAADCVVVSGAQEDDVGNFKDRKILDPAQSMVAGQKCKVVGGLSELKVFIKSGKVKKGGDLLIVFGAHGSKDNDGVVKFNFNKDKPTADEVYEFLKSTSQDYQVGAVLHACYSGEVMNKIIKQDADPRADKLCVLTSSSKGRSSFSNEKDLMNLLEKVKKDSGKNLEDIFLETPTGMISSAAWEEVGVPDYLRAKDLDHAVTIGFNAMSKMDGILRSPGSCATPEEVNSALCVAPAITDKIYKDLMHFSDPYIPNKHKGELLMTYTVLASLYEDQANMNPEDKSLMQAVSCFKSITSFYQKKLDGLLTWGDLENALSLMKKEAFYKGCESARATLADENLKATLYEGNMHEGLISYRESLTRLKKIYSKTNWDDFNLNQFALNASGDQVACKPMDKKQIIQSLFGESFFEEESLSDLYGNFDSVVEVNGDNRNISTQYMMKAFQNATVDDQRNMSHPTDAKRRKACQNFKF